jgi:hypothetical protein
LACEECDERRARRLALEEELALIEGTWLRSIVVVPRYVERLVYKPMPQKVVLKPGPVVYVDRPVDRIVERIAERVVTCWSSRSAGFFGRLGDKIDRLLGIF